MSGYDSETALVSQSSLEQGETHVIVSVNSSLTRFILILDIWFTQVELLYSGETLGEKNTCMRISYMYIGSEHLRRKFS